jgi:membrane protein
MNVRAKTGFAEQLVRKWFADETPRRAAALAFYTFLSLAPLLFVAVSLVGLVYGKAGAQSDIIGQVQTAMGPTAASAVRTIVENAGGLTSGIFGTVGGVLLLVVSAVGVFSELQTGLNVIWGVASRPRPGIVKKLGLFDRLLTFLALLGVGLLLLVSIATTTAVSLFAHKLGSRLPAPTLLLHIADFAVFLGLVTVLMAFLFKILPRATVKWADLWLGSLVTAFLFGLGKLALGVYLGRVGTGSSYGAAAGFVVLLLWIYYSAQIFLLGAQFTVVRASRRRAAKAAAAGGAPPRSAKARRAPRRSTGG